MLESNKYISFAKGISLPVVFMLFLFLAQNFLSVPENIAPHLLGLMGGGLAIILSLVFLKLDKSNSKNIGLYKDSKTFKKLGVGIILGIGIAILMLAIAIFFSDLKVTRIQNANLTFVAFSMMAFFTLSFMEELVFRAYAFIKLYKHFGLRITQVVMAILFAFYHDLSGVTFFQQLMGPGVWALIFGVAAVWSDGIAFPIGLHAGLNVVLGILGLKQAHYAIWAIDYPQVPTAAALQQTENIGMMLQFVLLLVGILLTEWLIRSKHAQKNTVYVMDKT